MHTLDWRSLCLLSSAKPDPSILCRIFEPIQRGATIVSHTFMVQTTRAQHAGLLYIKLPSFHVLPGLLTGDNDDQFRNLPSHHPLVELRHDPLDIRPDLVVGRYCG